MAHIHFGRLHHAVRDVARAGLALLFPPTCAGCGRIGELFCAHCAQAVTPTPAPQSIHQKQSPLLFTHAAALHSAPLREAIHAFKYENQPELAPLLARYLVATYAAPPWSPPEATSGSPLGSPLGSRLNPPIRAVVPVPLHPQRLAARGYNQAELLARHFCDVVGLSLQPTWLARIRETRQQIGLGPRARQANVEHAFVASPAVAGACLLLIDDVYTTGATLRACAAAAHLAGATAVYGLTLAQPVRVHHPSRIDESLGEETQEADTPDLPWWEGEM